MKNENIVRIMNKPRFNQMMELENINDFNIKYKLKDYAIISINDTTGKWSSPWFNEDHDNVIRLWFDDVLEDGDTISKYNRVGLKATNAQLNDIIDFIERNEDKKFIIHCSAGVSRSGAVGMYITRLLKRSVKKYLKHNPRVKPNLMILSRISFLHNIKLLRNKYKVTSL